jgi:hypothetical protein
MDVRKHGCNCISEAKCMWWQLQKQKPTLKLVQLRSAFLCSTPGK